MDEEEENKELPEFWYPLFRSLVPWSFHFHHAVRTCAQVSFDIDYVLLVFTFKYLKVVLYALIEETFRERRKVQIEDSSLLAMVRFLHNNKDCTRLRERQRWFSCMKKEKEHEREGKIQEKTEIIDKKEREDEGEDEEGEQDSHDEIIPMELLEHVKKALKEFQASLSNPGNKIKFY